jgi:uncharacterized iron-regulated membrane protein
MTTTMTPSKRRADSATLRRVWRLHFWVGLFAAPVLLVLSCTGLVILYSQPLDNWLNHDLFVVSEGPTSVPLDDQVSVAKQHVDADFSLDAVTPPDGSDKSTRVDFIAPDAPVYPNGESNVTQVFVDPYTGEYLGQRSELSGLVGWANQLHRMFGNDGPTVQLPSLGHLIAPSAYPDATIPAGVGNIVMELTATWILVLLATGIFLWWPRAIESAKPMFTMRWRKGGRIRWRDLHALTGVVVSVILICYILSGLTWSRYWGENWRAVAATVTPSSEIDAPSTPAKLGDYDRLGRRIAWAATDEPIPASQTEGPVPNTLGFSEIDQIAKEEHMVPGYAIMPPSDSTADGVTTYGSYTVVNRWPQKLSEQRTLYLNQFTGQTITNATAAQDGALSRLTSFGIAMHMGNQLGVLTRISATLACLGIMTSIVTGFLMWWKRRPKGGTGLPGPASGATRAQTPRRVLIAVGVLAVVLGVLYPVFGVSLLVVFVVEAVLAARRKERANVDGETAVSEDEEPRQAITEDELDDLPDGTLQSAELVPSTEDSSKSPARTS